MKAAYAYVSGWCLRPAECPGINGHHRCHVSACSCACHAMNAILDRAPAKNPGEGVAFPDGMS